MGSVPNFFAGQQEPEKGKAKSQEGSVPNFFAEQPKEESKKPGKSTRITPEWTGPATEAVAQGLAGMGASVITPLVGLHKLASRTGLVPPPSAQEQANTVAPDTVPGAAGNFLGTAAQFMAPGGLVGRGVKAAEALTKGSRLASWAARIAGESAAATGVEGVRTGGDPNAMKIAALIGAAAPVVGAGVGKVIEKVAKPFSAPAGEAWNAAKAQGIDPGIESYADKGFGAWLRRQTVNFTQNRTFGRQPIFEQKQAINSQAQGAAGRLADELGAPALPDRTGTVLRDTMKSADDTALKGLADKELERVATVNAQRQAEHGAVEADRAARHRARQVYGQDLADQTKASNEQLAFEHLVKTEEATSAQAASHQRNLASFARDVESTGPIMQPVESGAAVHEGINANENAFMQEARQRYAKVDALIPDIKLAITPIKNAWAAIAKSINGFDKVNILAKGGDLAKLSEQANAWAEQPAVVGFADAQQLLSSLKAQARTFGRYDSKYGATIKKTITDLESQMERAATASGKPEAYQAYKEANSFYKQGAELFHDDTSAAVKLLDKNPEQVAATVWKPGAVTPMRQVKDALTGQPDAWAALRRQGMEDLIAGSSKDDVIDFGKLQANWSKLGPEMQQEMAGGVKQAQSFTENIKNSKVSATPVALPPPPKPLRTPKIATDPFKPGTEPKLETPSKVELDLTPAQRTIRSMAERSPESVAGKLLNKNAFTEATEIRKALADKPAVWDSIRRQAFEQLVGGPRTTPGVLGGDEIINSLQMEQAWKNLGPQMRELLGGPQKAKIDQFMKGVGALDLEKIRTLKTAINGGIIDPMSALLGGTAMVLTLGSPPVIARIITSPKGIQWLTEGLKLKPGTTEAASWLAKGALYGLAIPKPKQLQKPPMAATPGPVQ